MSARRIVAWYLGLLVVFSSPFYAYLLASEGPTWSSTASAAFMACPALAALAATAIARGRFGDLGLAWGRSWRWLPGVFLAPFAGVLLVYAVVWVASPGSFDARPIFDKLESLGFGGASGSPWRWGVVAALTPVAVLLGFPSTLGEELGWRGLLAPRLVELLGVKRASLVTGLVWSAWHYPVMLVFLPHLWRGPPVWYATLCFTLSVTGIAFFYTWIRMKSGSVWPAVVLHSASNAAAALYQSMTVETETTRYWTFEYGAGIAIVILVLLALLWRRVTRESPA